MPIIHVKSLTQADFTGTVTVGNSAGATTTIAATDLARPSDWNSNHSIVFSLSGNTSVNSTAGATDLRLQGAGNITLAGSTGTLVISGPGVSTASGTVIAPYDAKLPAQSTSVSIVQNSVYIWPCPLETHVTLEHIRLPVSIIVATSATASAQRGDTIEIGIYTRHATNNTVLTRHYSTSYTMAVSYNSNVSMMLSLITAINNSTSYLTTTTSSAGSGISSLLHGARELVLPLSTLLTPGEWWWAVRHSTSSVGGGTAFNLQHFGVIHQTYNRVGVATNSSNSAFYAQNQGMGAYSTTSGALPGGVTITDGIRNFSVYPMIFLATGTV